MEIVLTQYADQLILIIALCAGYWKLNNTLNNIVDQMKEAVNRNSEEHKVNMEILRDIHNELIKHIAKEHKD